jgi:hypothetical protein
MGCFVGLRAAFLRPGSVEGLEGENLDFFVFLTVGWCQRVLFLSMLRGEDSR